MITSPEEFRQRLLDIQNSVNVVYSTLPSDEPRFIIDANSRTITIPPEFQFLGVKNDHNAETVYFEIDRYFDDEDLSQHTCVIQFANKNNSDDGGIYPVTTMDTTSVDGKIIFGWEIKSDATSIVGDIYFSVRFYSIDSENYIFTYNFNTLTAKSSILDTHNVDNQMIIENYPSELDAWMGKMDELSRGTEGKVEEIEAKGQEVLTEINSVKDSIPEDYSTLSSDVSELKSDLANINDREFTTPIGLKSYSDVLRNLVASDSCTLYISNKNLLPQFPTETNNGITLTKNDDGSITLNGTATSTATFQLTSNVVLPISNGTFTISLNNEYSVGDSLTFIQLSVNDNYINNAICRFTTSDCKETFTLSENERLTGIRIRISSGVSLSNYKLSIQIEEGTDKTPFVKHSHLSTQLNTSLDETECYRGYNYICSTFGTNVNGKYSKTFEELEIPNNIIEKVLVESKNLYGGEYEQGRIINGVNTVSGYENNYHMKDFLELEAGSYLYNCRYGTISGNRRDVFVYHSNGTYKEKIIATALYESGSNEYMGKTEMGVYTFTITEKSYVKINVGLLSTTDWFQILEGSSMEEWSETFVPYFEPYSKVEENIHINDTMVEDLTKIFSNPLYGKSIAYEGDSVCYGNGYQGGYGRIIGENNNMTVYNTAVGGSPITNVSGYSHVICTSVANMQSDCDYYICEGGYNDRNNAVTVGSLVSGFPIKGASDDDIDNTTLAGAMEYMCRDLVTLFAGKKVGFIFCHNRYALDNAYNTQYRPIMKQALEKWGVPYLDLQECIPPIGMISSLASVYTNAGDGTHPNKDGYEKYYVPKIEAWLKTL